jgi:hypothetical protein
MIAKQDTYPGFAFDPWCYVIVSELRVSLYSDSERPEIRRGTAPHLDISTIAKGRTLSGRKRKGPGREGSGKCPEGQAGYRKMRINVVVDKYVVFQKRVPREVSLSTYISALPWAPSLIHRQDIDDFPPLCGSGNGWVVLRQYPYYALEQPGCLLEGAAAL